MFVYLAGPIDSVAPQQSQEWRETAATRLADTGIGSFSPAHAYFGVKYGEDAARCTRAINDAAIGACDAMVAMWSPDAFGTIREIERAKSCGAYVVMIAKRGETIHNHLETKDLHLVDSIGDAVQAIINYRRMEEMRADAEISADSEPA